MFSSSKLKTFQFTPKRSSLYKAEKRNSAEQRSLDKKLKGFETEQHNVQKELLEIRREKYARNFYLSAPHLSDERLMRNKFVDITVSLGNKDEEKKTSNEAKQRHSAKKQQPSREAKISASDVERTISTMKHPSSTISCKPGQVIRVSFPKELEKIVQKPAENQKILSKRRHSVHIGTGISKTLSDSETFTKIGRDIFDGVSSDNGQSKPRRTSTPTPSCMNGLKKLVERYELSRCEAIEEEEEMSDEDFVDDDIDISELYIDEVIKKDINNNNSIVKAGDTADCSSIAGSMDSTSEKDCDEMSDCEGLENDVFSETSHNSEMKETPLKQMLQDVYQLVGFPVFLQQEPVVQEDPPQQEPAKKKPLKKSKSLIDVNQLMGGKSSYRRRNSSFNLRLPTSKSRKLSVQNTTAHARTGRRASLNGSIHETTGNLDNQVKSVCSESTLKQENPVNAENPVKQEKPASQEKPVKQVKPVSPETRAVIQKDSKTLKLASPEKLVKQEKQVFLPSKPVKPGSLEKHGIAKANRTVSIDEKEKLNEKIKWPKSSSHSQRSEPAVRQLSVPTQSTITLPLQNYKVQDVGARLVEHVVNSSKPAVDSLPALPKPTLSTTELKFDMPMNTAIGRRSSSLDTIRRRNFEQRPRTRSLNDKPTDEEIILRQAYQKRLEIEKSTKQNIKLSKQSFLTNHTNGGVCNSRKNEKESRDVTRNNSRKWKRYMRSDQGDVIQSAVGVDQCRYLRNGSISN